MTPKAAAKKLLAAVPVVGLSYFLMGTAVVAFLAWLGVIVPPKLDLLLWPFWVIVAMFVIGAMMWALGTLSAPNPSEEVIAQFAAAAHNGSDSATTGTPPPPTATLASRRHSRFRWLGWLVFEILIGLAVYFLSVAVLH